MTDTYILKKEWIGSTVTIFPPHARQGYDLKLSETTSQKELQTLFNTDHPAVTKQTK